MPALREYLKTNPNHYNGALPLLPLMHSCECFSARDIFKTERLEARFCKVFNKDLLYFYYGKPSYPVGEKVEEHRTDLEYLPVCFIIDFKKVIIHKAYPFDSGAFFANIYSDFFHRHMTIDDFELPSDEEGIKTYLSFMFGDNKNYFDGVAVNRMFTNEPNIDALVNLMTATGTMKFDERARTIEIISKDTVELKDALKCVILPKNLLQVESIVDFLRNNNIDYIPYNVRALVHPTSYYALISEKALEYINMQKEVC